MEHLADMAALEVDGQLEHEQFVIGEAASGLGDFLLGLRGVHHAVGCGEGG